MLNQERILVPARKVARTVAPTKSALVSTILATIMCQETPALRGLEAEAANVDASVRMIANERAVSIQQQKQRHLLLLQHAFFAFHQNLVQHLQASILTAPKELSVAAETNGETINAKTYLSFRKKLREKALSKKVLFLRKVQRGSPLHVDMMK